VRVAAIDCGTNSVRLLVADVADGRVADVHRETRLVRLGQGVDRDRRLRPEAIERTRAALHDYAATLRRLGAERVRMVATSATRDAANRQVFVDAVRSELGVEPEVVTGVEEAALALAGARSGRPERAGPVLVIDLGGGSTELVRGDGAEVCAHSMDVGSVRLTERHLREAPPAPEQVAAAEADVRAAVRQARADVALDPDLPVIGVAATVLTVAALALELPRYDPAAVDGATVGLDRVQAVTRWLLGATRAQIAAHPVVAPGREDVIAAGALILRTVLEEIGAAELVASEHDILDGIALSLADR